MDVWRGKPSSRKTSPSKRFRSAWESLGIDTKSGIGAVKRGLPIRHLEQFLQHAQLPKSAVLKVLKLTTSEYQKRIASRRLTPLESERLWRLAKVYKKSLDLFEGNIDQAAQWLTTPQRAFERRVPDTERCD